MTNKEIHNEFIIVSIDYIRLFGKNNYIKLYRKHIIHILGGDDDIEGVEIPPEGKEHIKIYFINTLTNELFQFTHILHSECYTLIQEGYNLLKALKRAIKIHKLNND